MSFHYVTWGASAESAYLLRFSGATPEEAKANAMKWLRSQPGWSGRANAL